MEMSGDAVDLSVVIAAYDAADTLPDQLEALAAQRTTCRWEVVLADNGSHDGTVAAALAFSDRLPVLRVVDASSRRGAGAARNAGARVARGRSLVLCDADDVVADGWLEAMHQALLRSPFVAGRLDAERLNPPAVVASRVLPQTTGLQPSKLLPGLWHAGAGNMGIRADVFRQVGGFDEVAPSLEDTDLCWRVGLHGMPLEFVPDALVHVRLRSGLRATVRQGYQYGIGERWLMQRFADVAAARATPSDAGTDAPAAAGRAGRIAHRGARLVALGAEVVRVRDRGRLNALCWSTAWRAGFSLGLSPAPVSMLSVPGGPHGH
ncbi:glycosyltransferase [Cellulomonas sp. P22]|uniref:glycosyltransferase n=1 Tax=Cellulomonas sp. P22 TaxID=3373189 RepID=UPI0037A0FAA5